MTHEQRDALLRRITADPAVLCGKPTIRGGRLAVEHVLEMLAAGDTEQTLLEAYPELEPEDIRACLLFGAGRSGAPATNRPAGAHVEASV